MTIDLSKYTTVRFLETERPVFYIPTEETVLVVFPFKVGLTHYADPFQQLIHKNTSAFDWLYENFGWRAAYDPATGEWEEKARWFSFGGVNDFYFKNERDAIEFKLRFA